MSFLHSWLITGIVKGVTLSMPLVEQELLNLLEHRVRVAQSSVFCVFFVEHCLPFVVFGRHCINVFWLPFRIFKLFLQQIVNSNSGYVRVKNQFEFNILLCWNFLFLLFWYDMIFSYWTRPQYGISPHRN